MDTAHTLTRKPGGLAVDTGLMVRQMDAKIATTANERHRRLLGTVREHMFQETQLSPGGVMATLGASADYKLWIDGEDVGPKGRQGIESWYIDDNIRRQKTFVIEYNLDKIIVDDDTVVTEGQMNAVVGGQYAIDYFSKSVDPDDVFLQFFRQVVFWPFNKAGDLIGEEFYFSGQANPKAWRKLERDEIPEEWYRLLKLAEEI